MTVQNKEDPDSAPGSLASLKSPAAFRDRLSDAEMSAEPESRGNNNDVDRSNIDEFNGIIGYFNPMAFKFTVFWLPIILPGLIGLLAAIDDMAAFAKDCSYLPMSAQCADQLSDLVFKNSLVAYLALDFWCLITLIFSLPKRPLPGIAVIPLAGAISIGNAYPSASGASINCGGKRGLELKNKH